MKISRRRLAALSLIASAAKAQKQREKLPSKTFKFEDLPVKPSGPDGQNSGRAVIDGLTHTGYHFDMHMTELAPGQAPHPPHRHPHEEMIMIERGTMEVTIEGKSTVLGPGSTAYVASNDFHGWKNAGEDRARYFVLALRGIEA